MYVFSGGRALHFFGGVGEVATPNYRATVQLLLVNPSAFAELAVNEPTAFTALVEVARKALPADVNAPRA